MASPFTVPVNRVLPLLVSRLLQLRGGNSYFRSKETIAETSYGRKLQFLFSTFVLLCFCYPYFQDCKKWP